MSYGIIYKAINLVNSKVYIGQTINTLEYRKLKHMNKSKHNCDTIFCRAIRKYGELNFDWSIIDSAESQDELNEKEIYWIDFYKSHIFRDDSNGYNMTLGGEGISGFNHSNETKRKMSKDRKGKNVGTYNHRYGKTLSEEAKIKISNVHKGKTISEKHRKILSESHKGENHHNYGKHLSEETKRKIGQSACRKGENNGMFGKKHSEETRKKIGDARRGDKSPNAKPVVKLDLDDNFIERFNTAEQGANSVGGDRSAVIKCCKGKQKHHKGFKWMYAYEYMGDEKCQTYSE